MMKYLEIIVIFILNIAITITVVQLLLYTVLLLIGLKKPKREYTIRNDKLSFLFLIPSCNEQYVIKDTLKNLKNIIFFKLKQ